MYPNSSRKRPSSSISGSGIKRHSSHNRRSEPIIFNATAEREPPQHQQLVAGLWLDFRILFWRCFLSFELVCLTELEGPLTTYD
jgi:hypothetical protein